MKKKQITSVNKAILRTAKKRGRRDGKNEVPRQDWPQGSVPYLTQLNKQFKALGNSLQLQFEQKQLGREYEKIDSEKANIRDQGKNEILKQEFDRAALNLEKIQNEFQGSDKEVPTAKFARVRLINNFLYYFFLVVLGYGEFLITVPALRFLLGEANATATIVAASVSFLTIATAHALGISLKTKLDRSKPHAELVTGYLIVVASLVAMTVLFLSYIRAAKGYTVSGNLTEIPENLRIWFLMGLYSILQFSFIAVGSYLSFLHHSEIEAALNRARLVYMWKKFRLGRVNRSSSKKGSNLEATDVSLEDAIAREKEVLSSRLQLLIAQYREVCAVYRDANIHARRDEIHGSHPSLLEEPLDENVFDFLENQFNERGEIATVPSFTK
jgi:hypothetical protein